MRWLKFVLPVLVLFSAFLTLAQQQPPAAQQQPPAAQQQPPAAQQQPPAASAQPVGVSSDVPTPTPAAPASSMVPVPAPVAFDQAVERITSRERDLVATLRQLKPVVETYIQNLRPDEELGFVPAGDEYFLGRLDLTTDFTRNRSMLKQRGFGRRFLDRLTSFFQLRYLPMGFAQMILLDGSAFDTQHYNFRFLRREFLGDIRCLVVDVSPKKGAGNGRFLGRIWVEDQDYNIVRFNGSYAPKPRGGVYLHFDSWRLNVKPGLWIPAYVYSEESELAGGIFKKVHFKSQTRLWGYDLQHVGNQQEYSTILVDAPGVRDSSEQSADFTPVESQRAWEHQAEQNVLERLTQAGVLSQEGEVDKIMQQVINNLEITNNLNIQPEVRARVMLTAPLESYTVGHTIVLSRGLIDVLPDEASLAAVLAHEIAHILLGHQLDTKYAFSDRMIFADETTFQRITLRRDSRDEAAADQKGLELLQNSPYKDKLASAGLFLSQLQQRSRDLPKLLSAHLGNTLRTGDGLRMATLIGSAPALVARDKDQIAALPLGGRIKLDPWSDKIELSKRKPVSLLTAREKMPFEVTPIFPYLTRVGSDDKVALKTGAGN